MITRRINFSFTVAIRCLIVLHALFGAGVVVAEEIIIDNKDAATSATGSWITNPTNPYNWGVDSLISNAVNSTFRWDVNNLSGPGSYTVYAWWTYANNRRAPNVPYRIVTSGNTYTVTVDQTDRSLAGSWVELGVYSFDTGSGYVEVSAENGRASADAVKLVRVEGSLIFDNRNAATSTTGNWYTNETNPYNWDVDSLLSNKANSTFSWELTNLPGPGSYTVYAWWTYASNKRTPNVPYRIITSGNTYTVTVDQTDKSLAGRWVELGIYSFDTGTGYIEVSTENGRASADAVKLVKVDPSINTGAFITVSDQMWDETAVRKVLHTFAFGGQSTDAQIKVWAGMPPQSAISEMLTFDQHNLRLSPLTGADYDRLDLKEGTLRGLSDFWSSGVAENGVPFSRRWHYGIDGNDKYQIENAWVKAATSRGLNSFRQKIGLWETNYHMATHIVFLGYFSKHMMVRYYDEIMNAHEQGLPYQDVIATAATSAAVAKQYGHFRNVYIDGECLCNEDFAREFHQLFFGILGEYDPDYHEQISIKNTAKALTDMPFTSDPLNAKGFGDKIAFGTGMHFPGVLDILNVGIGGNNADQKIRELSQYAINHPESLDNLPVKIISGLADDNLSPEGIQSIRDVWRAMPQKNFLEFIRQYAISELFHSPNRIKYLTSIDRLILIANKLLLNNEEGYLRLYKISEFNKEGAVVFGPSHIVFGGQTGIEAADSADVFQLNYNRIVGQPFQYEKTSGTAFNRDWIKDWAATAPTDVNGDYKVKDIAEWLWNRFVGDGLKNMGTLERGHMYSILGSGFDLGYLVDSSNPDGVITTTELENDQGLVALMADLAGRNLELGSADMPQREKANKWVGRAINFIVATPYLFAQEGR